MNPLSLRTIRELIEPLLEPLDQEVVQPGLQAAMVASARVRSTLDCLDKAAWVNGTHRHACLHGKLARFASRQQGWVRRVQNGVPIYNIGNGIELTVKRTPQGRSASCSSQDIAFEEFELDGHEQLTLFTEFTDADLTDSPIMHVVALDYVVRSDGQCLTAMLQRRGAKLFIPLAYVVSKAVLTLPAPQAPVVGPKAPAIRVPRRKVDE